MVSNDSFFDSFVFFVSFVVQCFCPSIFLSFRSIFHAPSLPYT